MFLLNGRRIYVKNGTHKQSINICSTENTHGQYDYVIYCRPADRYSDESLQALGLTRIEDLVEHLRSQPGCDVEIEPGRRQPVATEELPVEMTRWERLAIDMVQSAIDQLVLDFVEFPYLHRVEHSIHCELFRILKSHTMFATTYPMGHRNTQVVHKEWPRRGASSGGNIDLCIHSPDDLKSCTYRDFREGHLRPAIGIEIGLDYKFGHLREDEIKLIASECRTCFLVHLVREDITDNFPAVEDFLMQSRCKTAYARAVGNGAFVKLVNETEVRRIHLDGTTDH